MKAIIVSLALIVCWVSCAPLDGTTTKPPFVKLSCSGHNPDGFFVDDKDPAIFHQCSHGQHVGTFHCQGGTVFNETAQVCVSSTKNEAKCPKPEGLFPYPGNPHKFISCSAGHAFVEACAADLIFDESKQQCIYNDKGLTWPTDPTKTPSTPTGTPSTKHTDQTPTPITSPPTTVSTRKATEGTTVPSTAKPECEGKGYSPDPADKHKYFICHNGKKLHETCPDGMDFDPTSKQCQ